MSNIFSFHTAQTDTSRWQPPPAAQAHELSEVITAIWLQGDFMSFAPDEIKFFTLILLIIIVSD